MKLIPRLAAAATSAVVLLAATPTSASIVNSPTILTMPIDYGGEEQAYALVNETARLIDGAQKGATIRHLGYLLNTPQTVDALIRAYNRGVNVRVTLDQTARDAEEGLPESERLAAVLGRDRSKPSFVYYVKASGFSKSSSTNMHAKLTQISSTGTRKYVNFVSSGNLAHTNAANSSNAAESYDDRTLYDGLKAYFNAITADKTNSSYYRKATSGNVSLYMGPGMPTVIYTALGKITSCKGVKIDVAMFQWTDASSAYNIATRLWGLASKGCDVNVIINYQPDRILIGTKTATALLKKKSGRQIIDVHNTRILGSIYVHNKQLTVKTPTTTTVYAGSKNFNGNVNAEIVSVNKSRVVWDSYQGQFQQLWAIGTPFTTPPSYTSFAKAASNQEQEWDSAE